MFLFNRVCFFLALVIAVKSYDYDEEGFDDSPDDHYEYTEEEEPGSYFETGSATDWKENRPRIVEDYGSNDFSSEEPWSYETSEPEYTYDPEYGYEDTVAVEDDLSNFRSRRPKQESFYEPDNAETFFHRKHPKDTRKKGSYRGQDTFLDEEEAPSSYGDIDTRTVRRGQKHHGRSYEDVEFDGKNSPENSDYKKQRTPYKRNKKPQQQRYNHQSRRRTSPSIEKQRYNYQSRARTSPSNEKQRYNYQSGRRTSPRNTGFNYMTALQDDIVDNYPLNSNYKRIPNPNTPYYNKRPKRYHKQVHRLGNNRRKQRLHRRQRRPFPLSSSSSTKRIVKTPQKSTANRGPRKTNKLVTPVREAPKMDSELHEGEGSALYMLRNKDDISVHKSH